MVQDFGNRNSGIKFDSLRFLPLAGRVVKVLHLRRSEETFASFVKSCGDRYNDSIGLFQFQQACTELGMDEFATREEIGDFLDHIGLLQSAAPQQNYGGYGQS